MKDGWENVTDGILHPLFDVNDITVLKSAGLRDKLTPHSIFRRIMSDKMIDDIVSSCNVDYQNNSSKRFSSKPKFSKWDVLLFISMIVEACGEQIIDWNSFLQNPSRTIGLPEGRYNKFRKHFLLQ